MAAGSYNEGIYNYRIGVEADLHRECKVSLSYRGFGGNISREDGGIYASANGGSALLQDRGWLGLTIKALFLQSRG